MTIPISEVIEACARVCDEQYPYSVFHTDQRAAKNCAEAIRALAAKYDGCIVAEGEPVCKTHTHMTGGNAGISWSAASIDDTCGLPLMRDGTPLYRAKEKP
jgi:hypothetical protein